jgi:hypothetical protein
MSLLVQVKSLADRSVEFRLSLDLPSKPTDASEANSTWQDKDLGYLRFAQGYCVASKINAAYPDALDLWHLSESDRDSRFPKGTRLKMVTLWDSRNRRLSLRGPLEPPPAPARPVARGAISGDPVGPPAR